MSRQIPRLLITAGEPAGIGPELCLKIATQSWSAELIFIVDPELLKQYALQLSIQIQIELWTPISCRKQHQAGVLKVFPISVDEQVQPGILSTANARYVLQTLTFATEQLLAKAADAMITGPVHKGIINQAGITFSGHTEFLAEKSASSQVVMMLACPEFRVALVTTHLPLRKVADAVTQQQLIAILKVLHTEMKEKFNLSDPVIHVCGLNPHAGESGHMGTEEIEVIEPVLQQLRDEGYTLKGPLAADTALTPEGIKGADVTLAMYHDQGLSVLKYAGFGHSVNITLGLPFIRVSVDHGTALELAGTGQADCGSMEAAICQAITMVESNNHRGYH